MTQVTLSILGEPINVDCNPGDEQRMEDLAAALSRRLDEIASFEDGSSDTKRVLILAALGLMDEGQRTGAALQRARREIDRLNEAQLEQPHPDLLRRPA
jgi:cell division protein ZapA (FtsZ GTPase activity inhibitor)